MDTPSTNPKVRIPRLQRAEPSRHQSEPQRTPGNPQKAYVRNACENCRKYKTKCSREVPRCQSCEERGLQCIYTEERRSRLRETTKQNTQAIALLQHLIHRVNDEDKQRINAVLNATTNTVKSTASSVSERPTSRNSSQSEAYSLNEETHSGEVYAPGSAGSNEDASHLDEDLFQNYETRATGYFGQNSEVQWLRNLKGGTSSSRNARVVDSTFYRDKDNLELDIIVDAYELPSYSTIEMLFNTYISTVNNVFPMVHRVFQEQFQNLVSAMKQHRTYSVPTRWQAVLNLILAIAARYSHMIRSEWQTDGRDHLIYLARSQQLLELSLDSSGIVSAPDLLLVQATGLRSLYYLVIGHVSKAWIMIGISIRYAIAVGMHVRNDDPSASSEKKDTLMRTWWSLHHVECLLSSITGRPCILADEHCTVPVPGPPKGSPESYKSLPLEGNKSEMAGPSAAANPPTVSSTPNLSRGELTLPSFTSSLEAQIKLSLVTQRALSFLYSPGIASRSWEDVQKYTVSLANELDAWTLAAFPHGLVGYTDSASSLRPPRESILLRFQLYSTKILITRPCLCRLDKRIKCQSVHSTNLNHEIAKSCVQAAHDFTQILPDQPQPEWVYQNGPWWCIVHNIMQAATVFLLSRVHGSGTSDTSRDVSAPMRKLTCWLHVLRNHDIVARRAYKIFSDLLKTYAQDIHVDITELLAEQEQEDRDISQASQQNIEQRPFLDETIASQQDPNHSDFGFFQEQYETLLPRGNPHTAHFDINMDDMWGEQFDFNAFPGQQEGDPEHE